MTVPIMNMRTSGAPTPLNWPVAGDHAETAEYYDNLLGGVNVWLSEVTTPVTGSRRMTGASPDGAFAAR